MDKEELQKKNECKECEPEIKKLQEGGAPPVLMVAVGAGGASEGGPSGAPPPLLALPPVANALSPAQPPAELELLPQRAPAGLFCGDSTSDQRAPVSGSVPEAQLLQPANADECQCQCPTAAAPLGDIDNAPSSRSDKQ